MTVAPRIPQPPQTRSSHAYEGEDPRAALPDGSRLLNARVLLQQGDRFSIALLEGPADQPHS